MTFGMKFALWMDETERNIERLKLAKKYISIGKLSGAVGTYSNIDPFVEKYVCEKLGIEAARIATQVIQRDRHAGDYDSSVQSHQLNLMYQFNPNVAAFVGYVHNRAKVLGESNNQNGYQVGVLGNMKIAKRTTAWASIGLGNKITAYEIGVGYDLTKNFDVNLFYNDTKYKGFDGADFKTHELAAYLLEKETITGTEFMAILLGEAKAEAEETATI